MENFWDKIFLNNPVRDWFVTLAIIVVSLLVLYLFQSIIIKRIHRLTSRTKGTLDDFIISTIQKSVMPLLYILAIYFGLKYIKMPQKATSVAHVALVFVNCFFILRIITSFISYIFRQAISWKDGSKERERQAKGILLVVQGVVWLIGLIFLIDNLGYDITTLVAGLGIGGIAIALAAQTILGDLFSYFVIFFDKPFEIGDFIIVDDKMGTIEYIGIKTTRIRALGGEQIVCSNTDLTNSRVHNYKRLQERRVLFSFGVVYNTSPEKLRLIPALVSNIIHSTGQTRFDRVHFKSFGDFSLNFEVVYYILSPDYNLFMDIQQSINQQIFEIFCREKMEFAFPTQTVFINQSNKEQANSIS